MTDQPLSNLSNHSVFSESSCVASAAYDEKQRKLTVLYKNLTQYDYTKVPRHVYIGLVNAPSKGKFLNSHVKGYYNYTKKGGATDNETKPVQSS